MQPWDPRDVIAKEVWDFIETRDFANRVLRTVASVEALHGLATSGLSLRFTRPARSDSHRRAHLDATLRPR